jgi:hypothetical protein
VKAISVTREAATMIRAIGTSIATLCVAATMCLGQSPRPAREMVSITKALAGTWSATYTFIPEAPATDSTARGEVTWEPGPGGFTLLEKEHVSRVAGEQFLLLILWWDDSTHRFRSMLCSNSGVEACDVTSYTNSTLSWDGKTLVLDFPFTEGRRQMRWHGVWSDIAATSFTETGDVGEAGGPLKRVLTIHATRIAQKSRDSSPRE